MPYHINEIFARTTPDNALPPYLHRHKGSIMIALEIEIWRMHADQCSATE